MPIVEISFSLRLSTASTPSLTISAPTFIPYAKAIVIDCYRNGYSRQAWPSWKDIGDLLVPREFIDWTLMVLTEIRDAKLLLTDKALEDLRRLIRAVSQKVLREMTETDIKLYKSIASF
jgi:hypothetical protein